MARTFAAAPTAGTLADLDLLFRGFADPIRLRVLNALVPGELCVCELVDLLRLPQSTVSRHLRYLHRAGLVEVTRDWKFSRYRLAAPELSVHRTLLGCVRTCFRGIAQLDRERAAAEKKVLARAQNPC